MGHAPIPPQRPSLRPADLATEAPASPDEPQRDWQPVTLFDNVRWQALVRALLEKCAPDSPASGTLVTVQGGDVVLYRDAAGKLHSVRFEDKPAALRIGQRISEKAFSARANDHLNAELSREGRTSGPVLFAVGEDELGGALVLLISPAGNRSSSLSRPDRTCTSAGHRGYRPGSGGPVLAGGRAVDASGR